MAMTLDVGTRTPAPKAKTRSERKREIMEEFTRIPEQELVKWADVLYAVMNLAWTYVDTIWGLCRELRIDEVRKLTRAIRDLKREYDRFRQYSMCGLEKRETAYGELFEEKFMADFNRMYYGLSNEVSRTSLTEGHRMLVVAVQQALAVCDAVLLYARWVDTRIRDYGVWACDCVLVQGEFLKMYELLPQYAGDHYDADSQTRKLTARILYNRMREVTEQIEVEC